MKIYSLSDQSSRKENQDSYWSALMDVDGVETAVLCVCDGLGGLCDGALASKTIVSLVKDFFQTSVNLEDLSAKIRNKSTSMFIENKKLGKRSGTTCTLLMCADGCYSILHIGDSRCYKIFNNGSKMEKLTDDHTAIERLKSQGKKLTQEDYRKYKNVLSRCLGVSENAELDFYNGTFSKGDYFFVCSDGFWHTIDKYGLNFNNICNLPILIENCIELGESDNITVSLLQI